jgi:arylsulfatase
MQGKSLAPVLRDADAPAPRNGQYYECWANRAYYRDGWVAVSLQKRGEAIDFHNWTLHAHAEDFSESMDLRRQHPQKLAELVAAFDEAAWANMVYPLDNRTPAENSWNAAISGLRPAAVAGFAECTDRAPRCDRTVIGNRNFKIVALPARRRRRGVLFAIGDVPGAWCSTSRTGLCGSPITDMADFTRWSALRFRRASTAPHSNTRRSAGAAAAAGWCSTRTTSASGESSARP